MRLGNEASAFVMEALLENERVHETIFNAGLYTDRTEEERNDRRAGLEAALFARPAGSVGDVAIRLRALWPDLAAGRAYHEPPANQDDLATRRLWSVIQDTDDLARQFADGLQAVASLALPSIPRMVMEAGALAAGTTPERFRDGCDAAFSILKMGGGG